MSFAAHGITAAEAVRRAANWLLVPASVGLIADTALSVLAWNVLGGSTKNILVLLAVIIAGGLKLYTGSPAESDPERPTAN